MENPNETMNPSQNPGTEREKQGGQQQNNPERQGSQNPNENENQGSEKMPRQQ